MPDNYAPDLDFGELLDGIAIASARGRQAAPLAISVKRELTIADKEELEHPSPKGTEIQPLAKLRHTHHMAARLLAEGRPPGEVALVTGYSNSRISILQQDPAFAELVEYYRTQVTTAYVNVHERLAALGLATVDELQERLEADPESFKNRELMDLATMLLDRTVAPPKGAKPGMSGGGGGGAGVKVTVNFVKSDSPGPLLDASPDTQPLDLPLIVDVEAEDG